MNTASQTPDTIVSQKEPVTPASRRRRHSTLEEEYRQKWQHDTRQFSVDVAEEMLDDICLETRRKELGIPPEVWDWNTPLHQLRRYMMTEYTAMILRTESQITLPVAYAQLEGFASGWWWAPKTNDDMIRHLEKMIG